MTILLKGNKPENVESHNSLKLSFTNIWGLHSNFVDCESFLESDSSDIIAVCETNMDDSTDSFNLKEFYYWYAWSRSLCEGRTSFWPGLVTQKLYGFLLTFSTGFTSLSVLLLFPLWITFFVFMHPFWLYLI